MSLVPRIVIVDPARDLVPIVRGALALLNRQHILVEVPSAEDVLDEAGRWPLDLVVTAYRIPGEMDGIDLARAVEDAAPGVPVIVLAEEGDRVLDPETLDGETFQYYCRPIAEAFLRGLRAALDGEPVEPEAAFQPVEDSERGPVPPVDLKDLRGAVRGLMRDVGATGALLADRTGRVLINEGMTNQIDAGRFAALLGPSFARLADIAPLLGGRVWSLQYYDGDPWDVFALALGLHHFMCLVVDGTNRGAMGAVTMYGRRVADHIIDLIGAAAYESGRQEPPAAVHPNGSDDDPVWDADDSALPTEHAQDRLDADLPDSSLLEDFDADAFFDQPIDENLADSLFSLEHLEDIVSLLNPETGERVDYNQARDLGLLND